MSDCNGSAVADGVHGMVPRDRMPLGARKVWDFYERKPGAPFHLHEFGYYSLERWKEQGMPDDVPLGQLFGFDPGGKQGLGQLGWCEAAFVPSFDVKVLEDRGECEVAQDHAGRHVLFFKGRRNGFMPEYLDHPVKDMKTWEEKCKWRMDPASPERYAELPQRMENAVRAAGQGMLVSQGLIGGYMYLRSLMGPGDVLFMFYDQPELVHECMKTWFELADTVIARHQEHVTIDELFFAEDICYNHGPLISPDMMREFLFPYYQQLIANLKSRQIDKTRHLYVQVDTDGLANPVISVYQEIGMDVMSPFEVASGCDVVEIGRQCPELAISGGIDKRILANGRDAIDEHLDYILPAMHARGGYTPTCDHGVPEEVPYEDYVYFRQRVAEFG